MDLPRRGSPYLYVYSTHDISVIIYSRTIIIIQELPVRNNENSLRIFGIEKTHRSTDLGSVRFFNKQKTDSVQQFVSFAISHFVRILSLHSRFTKISCARSTKNRNSSFIYAIGPSTGLCSAKNSNPSSWAGRIRSPRSSARGASSSS